MLVLVIALSVATVVSADITGRATPLGTTVPNPGTQQQELTNITFPAPYNTFEFVVTCMACHGGSIDQNVGHGGNWAGTAMASAIRDPVHRANQIIVNNTVQGLLGDDGAGNVCIRCHSQNAWYSGRTDPLLGGKGDASNLMHSIVASTDDEGISCEFCHRVIGQVTMNRVGGDPSTDVAFNMLAGLTDWPHEGLTYPEGPAEGLPMGDATLQINDAMTYGGKWGGTAQLYFGDIPDSGTFYTGQTYGFLADKSTSDLGVLSTDFPNPDFAVFVDSAWSPEHNTFGGGTGTMKHMADNTLQPAHAAVRNSEFCGSCHDLTIPVLNHGMPEQRTYTEWKYSAFGDETDPNYKRCQDCHMPTMMHEYNTIYPDDGTGDFSGYNVDPTLAAWPQAKDRNITPDPLNGKVGTSFHKFQGANRDLPMMMKLLYPEVDLEVIGEPTGNDTRAFPGMLSDRSTMWDRAQRNVEVNLNGAVDVEIPSEPALRYVANPTPGQPDIPDCVDLTTGPCNYEVKVKVTNNSGHRIPSGYPDGRRLFLNLEVRDSGNNLVYESGYYDAAQARLFNNRAIAGLTSLSELDLGVRAQSSTIDATTGVNQVMIYEKRTGDCKNVTGTNTECTVSVNLLNHTVVFDNRIPPLGFTYADYLPAGAKFVTYTINPDGTVNAVDDVVGDQRFPDGQNWDEVTYRFSVPGAPGTVTLNASAKAFWQTHTREFMEHLKNKDTSTVRPEGPPSRYSLNYPLDPTYLSDIIGLGTIDDPFTPGKPRKNKPELNDNWGGVAYAAWLLTGMGAPYQVGADSTLITEAPFTPINVGAMSLDPFTLQVNWDAGGGTADGYMLYVSYGINDTTADWDKLAVLPAGVTSFRHEALNVAKTYRYKLTAFNGKGESTPSPVAFGTTPIDLPLAPLNLTLVSVKGPNVTIAWYDQADNETGFIIERQAVPVTGPYVQIADIPTPNDGGVGGVTYVDKTSGSTKTYNYRVAAYNASGMSGYTTPALQVIVK